MPTTTRTQRRYDHRLRDLVQTTGDLDFASPTTWYRLVRVHKWRRPRQRVHPGKPMLLVDGGVENFNSAVDEVVESGLLERVLAQTEITYSNSLRIAARKSRIEANRAQTCRTCEEIVSLSS